jgi:uncharacterized phage protein (TIGR02218 family)
MKSFSTALQNAVASADPMEAELWVFYFASGTAYWTNAGADISYGGNTYLSGGAIMEKGKAHFSSGSSIDTFDLTVHPGSATINGLTLQAAAAGLLFDGVRVTLTRAYYSGPQAAGGTFTDAYLVFDGTASAIKPLSLSVGMTIESLMAKSSDPIPRRMVQPACPFAFGDTDCKLTVPTCTGSISGGTTTSVVVAVFNAMMVPGSTIAFTDGALQGVSAKITSVSGSTLNLDQTLSSAPANGTHYLVTRACDRTRPTCISLGNVINFGGRPDAPSQSVMADAPEA